MVTKERDIKHMEPRLGMCRLYLKPEASQLWPNIRNGAGLCSVALTARDLGSLCPLPSPDAFLREEDSQQVHSCAQIPAPEGCVRPQGRPALPRIS